MVIGHDIEDAVRSPIRVIENERVAVWVGAHPLEPGQFVTVFCKAVSRDGAIGVNRIDAHHVYDDRARNDRYWLAEIGPFRAGDEVTYAIGGVALSGDSPMRFYTFHVH